MKTKAEILQKHIDKTKYLSSLSTETGKLAIFQAMEEYAQQLPKELMERHQTRLELEDNCELPGWAVRMIERHTNNK